jgi:hypothetical protein
MSEMVLGTNESLWAELSEICQGQQLLRDVS